MNRNDLECLLKLLWSFKGVFWNRCQDGFEKEMFEEWSKKRNSWSVGNINYVIDWGKLNNERGYDTPTWMENCGKLREKFGEKKRTTIFALPQALKRQSGLAFSSHRFTMTQERGNNTHFPSFCFPRDMFFFYILSSFLSSIFCLLLLWVASLSLIHNEQEGTLLPERKNTRQTLKKKENREEEN